MQLTEDEIIIIETLRKDRMLKKAVYRYFEVMADISLNGFNEKKEKK